MPRQSDPVSLEYSAPIPTARNSARSSGSGNGKTRAGRPIASPMGAAGPGWKRPLRRKRARPSGPRRADVEEGRDEIAEIPDRHEAPAVVNGPEGQGHASGDHRHHPEEVRLHSGAIDQGRADDGHGKRCGQVLGQECLLRPCLRCRIGIPWADRVRRLERARPGSIPVDLHRAQEDEAAYACPRCLPRQASRALGVDPLYASGGAPRRTWASPAE